MYVFQFNHMCKTFTTFDIRKWLKYKFPSQVDSQNVKTTSLDYKILTVVSIHGKKLTDICSEGLPLGPPAPLLNHERENQSLLFLPN